MLQASPEYRMNPEDLYKFYAKNKDGNMVPYSNFMTMDRIFGPNQITRYNMVLKVDYLVVSNGMQHYCCRMDYERNSYTFLPDIPDYQTL